MSSFWALPHTDISVIVPAGLPLLSKKITWTTRNQFVLPSGFLCETSVMVKCWQNPLMFSSFEKLQHNANVGSTQAENIQGWFGVFCLVCCSSLKQATVQCTAKTKQRTKLFPSVQKKRTRERRNLAGTVFIDRVNITNVTGFRVETHLCAAQDTGIQEMFWKFRWLPCVIYVLHAELHH